MRYFVNDTWIEYTTDQPTAFGTNEVLLKKSIDLSSATSWHERGFGVEALYTKNRYEQFHRATYELLDDCWRKSNLEVPDNFNLADYHLLANNPNRHLAALENTKLLQVDQFPAGIAAIEERISEICKVSLVAKNPFDDQSVFHFRVVRPMSKDNNPLHRDVWLEDYDDCINLYIPIAGSTEKSSLIILPGSHLWPESHIEKTISGAQINNIKFNVPAVTNILGEYTIERPSPRPNEVLVFSPYLIHGGAVNLNANETRISIELRLWRRN